MKNDMRYESSLLKFFFSNDFPLEHTLSYTDWLIVLSIKYYALTIIAHMTLVRAKYFYLLLDYFIIIREILNGCF